MDGIDGPDRSDGYTIMLETGLVNSKSELPA